MKRNLEHFLLLVLALGFITLLGHEMKWWGPKSYECVFPEEHETARTAKTMYRAYHDLIHCIWIDNPDYVENELVNTEEFCVLDSLLNGDWEDTFDFWNKADSILYVINKRNYINPDKMPTQPRKECIAKVIEEPNLKLGE